jgi:hypothetical protein
MELTAEGPQVLRADLPHWDYSTSVTLQRELVVDAAGVRRDCQIGAEDRIAAVVVWRATGTTLRGLASAALVEGDRAALRCDLKLSGRDLGGTLRVETQLVLGGQGTGTSPLAAGRIGSILWRDLITVVLEGVAARFPVEVIDFAESGIPAKNAAWYLEWPRGRLHESATGETRLYVNRRRDRIVDAVSMVNPDESGRLIWSAIRHDVGRTLIEGALADEEFVDEPGAFESGTMGASIRRLLQTLWPGEEPRGLAGQMRQAPDDFSAELQDRLQLFGES